MTAQPARPLVVANASVHRIPGDPAPATAVAIADGAIVTVGSVDDARAALPDARVVELGGRTVLPAFIDAHTHFHRASVLRDVHLDFEHLAPRSIADVLSAVRDRAAETAPEAWIEGDSISAGALAERRLPTGHELDAAAGDRPTIIRGIGKHVVAASSAALALAGIDRDTPDPPGGRIERDADGEPTGILHERAKLRLDTSAADSVVPPVTEERRLAALRRGIARLHGLGVTAIGEMVRLPEEIGDLARLHGDGELDVRVRAHYRVHETQLSLDALIDLGLRRGWGDDRLRVGGIKISIDGWCIFRNAAVHEPYAGEPDNVGLLRIDPPVLDDLVARADAAGLGVAVHAVGARAVDAALDAFERAGPQRSGPHRIEHAHLDVDAERLTRMRDLGLVLSAQPALLDAYRADWEEALEPDRIDRIMPIGSAHRMGIPVIIDSDMPSGPAGPLRTIAAAVRRTIGAERPGGGEALSIVDAWRAHTTTVADVSGDRSIGRLERGRRADLVVLDGRPFEPGADVPTDVEATLFDGAVVHDRAGLFA